MDSMLLRGNSAAVQRTFVIARHLAGATTRGDPTGQLPALSPAFAAGGLLSHARSFLFDPPVEESAQHAGEAIARVLAAHGVKFVFCLAGGHIAPILVGAEQAGIRVIDVRHEVNAVFAADAVARLTGVPGVAVVTAGPGVTNTVTAVKNASMAQSPLVLLGGAAPLAYQGKGALQDIDQRVLLEPIVKRCWTVTAARDIVPTLREAFCEAASGVPGPVFVELPLDILYSYLFIAANFGLYKSVKKSQISDADLPRVVVPVEHSTKSRKDYLDSCTSDDTVYLRRSPEVRTGFTDSMANALFRHRFAGALSPVDVSPLPVHMPLSSAKDLQAAAVLLCKAKRPVLVLGSQSTLQAQLTPSLAAAVERLGAPTFLGGMARGLLGRNSKCFVRQNRSTALRNCDLVILAGTVVDFRMSYGKVLPKPDKAKIIAVSRDQAHLELNTGVFDKVTGGWTPTLASLGDPCDFIIRLADMCPGDGKFDDWGGQLRQAERLREDENAAQGHDPALGRGDLSGKRLINPINLLHLLEQELTDKSVLVGDGGDFVATASYIVRPRGPLQWLDPGSFGTLGVGGGFALGAKLARPDSDVWLLWGDGAAGYSIAEFDTFARHGVPIVALVGNDACWGQIERDQTPWLGSPVSCELSYCRYEAVAEGYGGIGFSLASPSEDIAGTLRRAVETSRENRKPVLINALVGRTSFREGSISA